MAYLPNKQCPVCGTVYRGNKCPECKPARPAPAKAKPRAGDPVYRLNRWRRKSEGYRRRHPFCEHCLQAGLLVRSTVVDHIVPLSKGGAAFDDKNLQALCHQCHAIKTAEE